jgi:hypothetical protein
MWDVGSFLANRWIREYTPDVIRRGSLASVRGAGEQSAKTFGAKFLRRTGAVGKAFVYWVLRTVRKSTLMEGDDQAKRMARTEKGHISTSEKKVARPADPSSLRVVTP